MATITINAIDVPNWQRADDIELRIYTLDPMVLENGAVLNGIGQVDENASRNDNHYKAFACTVDTGTKVLHVPSVTVPTTTDAISGAGGRLGAYLFTQAGVYLSRFGTFGSFQVPDNLDSPTTWGALQESQP